MSFSRALACLSAALFIAAPALAARKPTSPSPGAAPPVTITDHGGSWTLSNGYLTIQVDKKSADLTSVKTPRTTTPNIELMGYVSGHHAGYWEQEPTLAPRREARITIDPATNGGERAEVSVKGWSDGKSILGQHPTAAGQGGGLIADLEIRYPLSAAHTASIPTPSTPTSPPTPLARSASPASDSSSPAKSSTGSPSTTSATPSCPPARTGTPATTST